MSKQVQTLLLQFIVSATVLMGMRLATKGIPGFTWTGVGFDLLQAAVIAGSLYFWGIKKG